MLINIKVIFSGQSSDLSPINISVPQGFILTPFLFFIDDLVDSSENELYLNAYDCTLLARVRSVGESDAVAASLN